MTGGRSHWRNLIAACVAISVFGFAFGMTYPLLSLLLEARGISPEMIGINAAMAPIGILLFSPVIPIAARRFGARNTAVTAALLTSLLFIAFKIFPSFDVWFVLRLVQGMSMSTLFVLSEAWIVKYADEASRGRIVAIYASVLSASFGAGPAVIGWIGIDGWTPFVIGFVVLLAGVLPLLLVEDEATPDEHKVRASSVIEFAPRAPVLLAAVGIFAIFDAATLSLLPVYGKQMGLSITVAANALTALIVGNIVLQFPIGWLADRYDKRRVLLACAVVTLVALMIVPDVMGTIWMWPVLIIAGASGYAMYTVSLAALGDRFEGDELVTGTSAFSVMWGSGALVGAILGGWAMKGFGPHGLPYSLAAVLVIFIAGMLWRLILLRQQD